ncbi:MAG: DUF4476 domain-containing protein [Bacteroidetes bacterium]|nr:DUF4476 domain-containing protein [Bacteroidota bacterium]
MFRPGLILVFIFFLQTVFHAQTNDLVIFSATGKRFILTVNNDVINTVPQSNVKAFAISPGVLRLKIKFQEAKDSTVFYPVITIGNDKKYLNKEFTYVITDSYTNPKALHALRFVTVNDTSGPEKPPIPEAPKEVVPMIDNSIYGILYKAKDNKPVFFNNYHTDSRSCDTSLSQHEMRYFAQLMNKSNDLERKSAYVTDVIQNNCYSVAQLMELVSYFTIELDKLKACKEGYWHLTDKQNASRLREVLVYKSIQEDYDNYLEEIARIEKQQKLACKEAVGAEKMTQMMAALKAAAYENEKLKVAKKQLSGNCFSCEQIRLMATSFHHDRERIDFVKSSYRVVVDKQEFYKLSDIFDFAETKDEFNKLYGK